MPHYFHSLLVIVMLKSNHLKPFISIWRLPRMKVYLGTPRGFCAGVVRAIDIVKIALEKYGAPIYVKHQIVHNPYVVKSLEKQGAYTVENIIDIPEGSTVIFSAHGSPPEDFEEAAMRNLRVIDATCPLVTKVHNEATKYHKEGRNLVMVGHRGHQEVKGSMGQAPMYLVDDREDIEMPNWKKDTPITILTQTTLSVDDTESAIKNIKTGFKDVIVRNDLCYATTNRQVAVKELCKFVDTVLVIGAPNSSNCNRLREVAEKNGIKAYLVNGPEDINSKWLENSSNLGITSGASTPELLVENVIEYLDPEEVITLTGADEDINFKLPAEI